MLTPGPPASAWRTLRWVRRARRRGQILRDSPRVRPPERSSPQRRKRGCWGLRRAGGELGFHGDGVSFSPGRRESSRDRWR